MSSMNVAIRRWNSAPLDPSPPPVLRSEAELLGAAAQNHRAAEPTIPEGTDEAASTNVEEGGGGDPSGHGGGKQPSNESNGGTTDPMPTEDGEEKDYKRGSGCGRGIVRDFKSTVGTWWCQEMTNFNQKTVAVSFFLFFACIAPAITFGAVYGKATENRIGAVEMIVATAWCGIIYGLIGGQPMMINGGTGPVLAFSEILFKMSESMGVPFLTFNAWVGLWVALYMFIAAFGGLNRIIAYATRFTDEIFALLIATIFIINALGSPFAPTGIFYYFQEDHKSHEEYGDDDDYSHTATALLSFLVCIGTVQTAFSLRRVKFSPFLPKQSLRNLVTDFAVVSSVVIWTVVAALAFDYVPLEKLNVPDSVAPTFACCTDACDSSWPEDCLDLGEPARRRSWLVSLGDLNGKSWVPIMAAGPALLAFILVFLDDGITWHLINHPAHKLTHGAAYDYDTVIIGLMIAINSMFGLPFLVAATVRSQNHVHALAEKDPQGRILSVQETRLTHLLIHVLCLVALFALNALKLIPMPVLYGVFLFMGLVSLQSNTLWNRFLMFFMQPSKYPLEPYTMHMKPKRMHLFTAIQIGLFALLYTVKAIKTIAIAFPIIIALCIPVRLYLLPKIFTEKELVMIDGDDDTIMKWLAENEDVEKGEEAVAGETHHGGEAEEFVVEADIEKRPKPSEAEEEKIEKGEKEDLALPLPTEEIQEKGRRPRRQRKKAVSCPSPHLFFSEVPFAAPPEIGLAVVHEEPPHSETTSEAEQEVVATATVRRRPRRTKAMSCPTHILMKEADRQMAENYFFG